jgi:hypothetical protein
MAAGPLVVFAQDTFPPGYIEVQDEDTALTKRRRLNFEGAGVSCADDSTKTTCTIAGGAGGNAFETIAVPAGTNPVADSSTDTLTITETSPLVITGTAASDTIDITMTTSPASAATVVGTGRTLTGGSGIAAIGDLSADRTIDLDLTELTTATLGAGTFTTLTFDAGTCDPRVTSANKTLTLGCVNGTNNESLTLDFDTVANRIDLTSTTGVTAFDFNDEIEILGRVVELQNTAASQRAYLTIESAQTSPALTTDEVALDIIKNDAYDTTAASRYAIGIRVVNESDQTAGANPYVNYSIYSDLGGTGVDFKWTYYELDPAGRMCLGCDPEVAQDAWDPPGHITIGQAVTAAFRGIAAQREDTAATAGTDFFVKAGGAVSGGTNLGGGDLSLISGIATGNGSSEVIIQTVAGSQGSGTTDRSPVTSLTVGGGAAATLLLEGGASDPLLTAGNATLTLTAAELRALANLTIGNGATTAGVLTLLEDTDAGSNFASFQVPALAANTVYTLPANDGDANQFLQTDGTGGLTWATSSGSGDITDVYNCASGDCNNIVLADGDLLNMSSVSVSSTTEGLILPQHATDCSTAGTAEGQVCWEADANTLYIGNGATVTQIGSGSDTNADKEFVWPMSALLMLQTGENIPPLSEDAGTNVDMLPVDFDQSTDECRTAIFIVPPDITSGGTVTFTVVWYAASVTTGNVIWDIRHNSGVAEGVDPDQTLTVEASAADAVQGTAGQVTVTTWTETQTNLAWAASDTVVAEVCRDANNASDTFAADARALLFGIRIPRS